MQPFRATACAALLAATPTAHAAGGHAMPHEHAPGHTPMHETHAHDSWPRPPAVYRGMRTKAWDNAEAIERGGELYARHCLMCHGNDGRGTGVVAGSLEHAPADLTRHLHSRRANNDDYLYWRVSEGGLAEPFRSQGSAMPAFKDTLTGGQRWDVLAYIHAIYHRGHVD